MITIMLLNMNDDNDEWWMMMSHCHTKIHWGHNPLHPPSRLHPHRLPPLPALLTLLLRTSVILGWCWLFWKDVFGKGGIFLKSKIFEAKPGIFGKFFRSYCHCEKNWGFKVGSLLSSESTVTKCNTRIAALIPETYRRLEDLRGFRASKIGCCKLLRSVISEMHSLV